MKKSERQRILRWASTAICIWAPLVVAPILHGATVNVPAAGDFQQALVNAQPGDTIVLEAGATYTGNFTLPLKSGDSWITILSSQLASLPAAGRRVTPLDSGSMPRLVCSDCPVLQTAPGAHHYRFVGIEFSPTPGKYAYDLITLGSPSATSEEQQAHHIEFDRVYAHGDSVSGGKRGISLQSAWTTIKNSYFSDFKSDTQDAQAICGWNGPGPYRIENNYLEASGENILFGGSAPSIQGLVPSDIVVVNNHFRKPPEWAGVWMVKNLLEMKSAQRVTIWGNVFENNWPSAQNGFAILFTVRTCEGGDSPWSVVRDVTFTYNRLSNIESGVNILGQDNVRSGCGGGIAGQTSNITIANNVFEAKAITFKLVESAKDIFIDHNTTFSSQAALMADGRPSDRVMYTNNLQAYGGYGIFGTNEGSGSPAVGYYLGNSVVRRNVFFGAPGGGIPNYPYDNEFLPTADAVGFQDLPAADYSLDSSSPYKQMGLDGMDLGADMAGLTAATGGVAAGNPQPAGDCFPSATPTAEPMGANGGSGLAAITAGAGCPWTAVSNADWITITSASLGHGNGTVEYTVGANNSDHQRIGTVTLAGHSLSLVQGRSGCSYSTSPAAQTFGAVTNTTSSFSVATESECNWTATSNDGWISVYWNVLRTGAGAVFVALSNNDSPNARRGSVTVGDKTYLVTQEGMAGALSISPAAQAIEAAGGPGAISVTCSAGSAWTVASYASWITISSGTSGSGSGVVGYTVAANSSSDARTGTVAVAGKILTVTQAGMACSLSISPTAQAIEAAGGPGTISVTCSTGCAWTVASNANWITINSGSSRSGSGVVSYTVAANSSSSPRTGTATVAGQTVTVTQEMANDRGLVRRIPVPVRAQGLTR
jgi:hypothetical protein